MRLAHATLRANQQLDHNVSSSVGYGEMASSKREETNPAVIDLTLQSTSSHQLRGEHQYFNRLYSRVMLSHLVCVEHYDSRNFEPSNSISSSAVNVFSLHHQRYYTQTARYHVTEYLLKY